MLFAIRRHALDANATDPASPINKTAPAKGKRKPAAEGTKRKRGKKSDDLSVEDDEEGMNVKKQKASSEDEAKDEDHTKYEMIAIPGPPVKIAPYPDDETQDEEEVVA